MAKQRTALDDAIEQVREVHGRLVEDRATRTVPLERLAGRVLATAVVADRDVPERSQATMDGFAVTAGDDPPLEVRGIDAGPGDDPPAHESGTAFRVATGGPIPGGADAVVPVERATVADGTLTEFQAAPQQHAHVLPRGTVVEAGETVLERGRALAPRDAVVLRDLGHDRVTVRERLSVGILATGTEIHEGPNPDKDSEMLANLVRSWGGDPALAGSVPDDPDRVGERIGSLADGHDVVLTTGGTSVGRPDETAGALADRAELLVDDVPVRPGSNARFAWSDGERAERTGGTAVAALPGKPGAAFVSAFLLVRPLFFRPSGEWDGTHPTVQARLAADLVVPDADVTFVIPVEFTDARSVVPLGHDASSIRLYGDQFRPHRVASCVNLSAADGVVLADDDRRAGDELSVVPYPAVER